MTDNHHYTAAIGMTFLFVAFACSGLVPIYRRWEYASAVYIGFVILGLAWVIFSKRDRRKSKPPQ